MPSIHALVLCRNLKLLGFSFEQNNVPFDPETFSAFFRIPRKPQFVSILRFLLLALDEGHFSRELSQHTCPTSETALKCVISKWLRECRPAIKLPASVFSVLGYPGGVTAVEFLSVLSSFVLQSKLSSVPDCLADLVSSIHGLIRSKVRDRAVFCTIDKSLSSHLVKREEQLSVAKTGLSKVVAEVKPLREEGKLNLYRFLRSTDALFSVGCQILDIPSQEPTVDPTTSGTTQDDAIVDWCSRVFKRAAYLCNPADSPSASSTTNKSPHQPPGQSQICAAENGLEELMLLMRSFIVSNQPTESQLTPLTSYRRQSARSVLELQQTATTNYSFPSDRSSTHIDRYVDVISSSPLRSFELSQLSGTPAATARKASTPRHLDVGLSNSVLQSWNQDLGKLDTSEKQALKISDLEVDSVQTQNNTSDEIENTDPFERSVAVGEQITSMSTWISVEPRTTRSQVISTEQRSSTKFSSDLSHPRQTLKTLNQNSLDPATVGANFKKSHIEGDTELANFNLFGDSMDFVDDLVPSSPT
ncbi:hypothetical protein CRM22_004924 [Opisthorchis felineus]|uniref:Uncharacterized protein n=1 Tax=Opisthorchis felineus TaxID=147828 RepID=A0A4S2LTY1_OPIFE|nr:hypothetical protein CRM22_004924 [Opisthorchis felineus]